MTRDLLGRRALVTGTAQGIGAGIATALRAVGAQVVGLDRVDGRDCIGCDLAEPAQIQPAVDRAAALLGGIDIVVNNAGVNEKRGLPDIDLAYLDKMIGINLRAPVLVTQAALRHMERGHIVNIVSELAYLGRAQASVYCATKGALLSLTRAWARELSPRILVNAVAPGPTDTPMLGFEDLEPERQATETDNPMGRIGTVQEVAATVVFLCGRGGDFYTGQCLGPNGGAAMI